MIRIESARGRGGLLMEASLVRFHRYLLLLTHPRCYSTLLCHILGSHPQICGYAEGMISYETPLDLLRLNANMARVGNYRGDCEYVLDKILYNNFDVSDAVLGLDWVTPIFLIREPVPAIESYVRLRIGEHERGISDWGAGGADPAVQAEFAATYYAARLTSLRAILARLEAMGRRGVFLTAESLVTETAPVFRLLERELGLIEPLREEYQLFPYTGTPGIGDTSPVIRSGRIVRERDDRDETPVPIRPDLLDRARQVYEGCLSAFGASPAMARVGG